MPDLTTNHGLQLWAAGELDWEHRDDMQHIERTLTIRDFDANLSNYTPYDGARFEATDTGAIYLGDGSNWDAITPKPTQDHIDDTTNPHSVTASQADALPLSGGSLTGDLDVGGILSVSSGTIQQQRGAPTTTELADGERMTYTSDGTDAHSAGDLVSARNNAGTIVSQVIAAAADDA